MIRINNLFKGRTKNQHPGPVPGGRYYFPADACPIPVDCLAEEYTVERLALCDALHKGTVYAGDYDNPGDWVVITDAEQAQPFARTEYYFVEVS
jgi:hypothetical protein